MSRYLRERSHSIQSEADQQEQIRLFAESPDCDPTMNSYNPEDDNHNETTPQDMGGTIKTIKIERPVMSLEVLTSHDLPRPTVAEKLSKFGKKCKCSPLGALYSLMPIFYWLPRYNFKKDITLDLIAGFTVAVMQIPQGMAYALLANLPPVIGLYMAFFPVIVYAIMGTSRHVSIGTFAVICLMTGKVALERLDEYQGDFRSVAEDDDNFRVYTESPAMNITIVEISATLSLSVGLWLILFGILHTGVLSLLLSTELVSGFTTGATFHVFTSQVRTMLGLRLDRRNGVFKILLTYYDVFANISSTNLAAVVMSAVTLVVLIFHNELIRPFLAKKFKIPIPIELICIVAGTVASAQWNFHEKYGVSIIHEIPTGLPAPVFPRMDIFMDLLMDGLFIGIVSYAISISMVKIFSTKYDYEIDPNQELIAQGASNAVGSAFSCGPIAVSVSRSAIQADIGGKTQLASLVSAGLMLCVLLWIAPFFETLPNCVLSAIIVVALKNMLLQVFDLPKFWQQSRLNAIIWIATALATIVLDIEYGLGVGVGLSVLVLIWTSNAPTINVLGSFAHLDIYADANHAQVKEIPGIKIIKYTGSLNFLTIDHFITKLETLIPMKSRPSPDDDKERKISTLSDVVVNELSTDVQHTSNGNLVKMASISTVATDSKDQVPIDYIILDLSSVSSMDPAAVKALQQTYNRYQAIHIQMFLVGPTTPVLSTFSNCQVLKEIGLGKFFPTIHDAISYASGHFG